jgi:peptide/nickel transport system substrate-binding protein
MMSKNVYSTLLSQNKDMTAIELDLAESWRQIDERTYEFKLRKGVRFHNIPPVNGREITSEDVKYSILRMSGKIDKKRYTWFSYFKRNVVSMDTPDRYTIIFHLDGPYAPFITFIASPHTAIVPKELVEKEGDLKKNAIGTGPFIFKDYVKGSYYAIKRNPNYFKEGLPYLDGIHVRIMDKPQTVLSAFLAKRLDTIGAYHFQVPTIKKEAPKAIIVRQQRLGQYTLRMPACTANYDGLSAPWKDRKVRQALGHAIDKRKLMELVVGEYGRVAVGTIVPDMPPWSLPESDQIEYNPEKSKKLLAEAGYPNGFSTEILTYTNPIMSKIAQVIQEMIGKVGMDATLSILPPAQYFNKIYRYKAPESICVHSMIFDRDPTIVCGYFGRPELTMAYKWCNESVWEMCDKEMRELDVEKRVKIIHEIQREINRDGANLFLFSLDVFRVSWPYVHRPYYLDNYAPLIGEKIWMEKH